MLTLLKYSHCRRDKISPYDIDINKVFWNSVLHNVSQHNSRDCVALMKASANVDFY